MAKVYMDTLTNQIVTPAEAEKRLFENVQDFEWKDTLASFPWPEIETELEKTGFLDTVVQRFKDMRLPLRFTKYEIYGDESPEDEKGEGENRIWPPEDDNDDNGENTENTDPKVPETT